MKSFIVILVLALAFVADARRGRPGRGGFGRRGLCRETTGNQCPAFSRYIAIPVPVTQNCPDPATLGGFGREDEMDRHHGGGFRRNICSTQNPTGTTLAPNTSKVCSYCKTWFPFNVTALSVCDISCSGETLACRCTPV